MIGQTLSHFKITAKLGEGGMGEVYRAEDTKLGRDVAIKVLPEAFVADPERMVRFEREARVLASLNHPNIAAIYELGHESGVHFLAMELVEGQDLAELLTRGALSPAVALPIARQIAAGLEAAHGQNIVHRDLKPANVMIRDDSTVKILDFGLAKAASTTDSSADLTQSPTLTARMTEAGVLLGTAAYMSPEQARGLDVDKQTDVWAFGCVLYDTLTGTSPFVGPTVTDTLVAILEREPAWEALPAGTPRSLRRLLRRCLHKERSSRLHDIADARIEIDEILAGEDDEAFDRSDSNERSTQSLQRPHQRIGTLLPWATAIVAGALALVLLITGPWLGMWSGGGPETMPAVETAILPPVGYKFAASAVPALSPDGTAVVFGAAPNVAVPGLAPDRSHSADDLWLRTLDRAEPRRIEGTGAASFPFWSPDGEQVVYFAEGELRRVDLTTGSIETVAPAPEGRGGTWCSGDKIVYAPDLGVGLRVVEADGGPSRELTSLDAARGETEHRLPFCLPSGEHVLMLAQTTEGGAREDESHIDAVALATGERTELLRANSSMAYFKGHLMFWRSGDLLALPFEPSGLRLGSRIQRIASDVAYTTSEQAVFSVGGESSLIYQNADPVRGHSRLLVVDQTGEQLGEWSEARGHGYISPARHSKQLAYQNRPANDIWIHDLARGTASRLTHEDGDHWSPVWTHDGDWIVFGTDRSGPWQVFRTPVAGLGEDELLIEAPYRLRPTDVSPDDRYVSMDATESDGTTHIALYDTSDRTLSPFIDSPFSVGAGRFSPDGNWFAYVSNETGREEVYVTRRGASSAEGRFVVSNSGGFFPQWSPEGDRLFYIDPSGTLQFVTVERSAARPGISEAQALFTIQNPEPSAPYGVLPDGKGFVITRLEESEIPDHLIFVQNWSPGGPGS